MIVSSTTSAADIALLDRIARRDQAGLAELYDRHCRLLFSLILRILRDRGEAEDVLQEVFVRVWDRADSYNPSLGTPAAWLVRISRNRAIDRLRSRTVRAGIQAPEVDRPEQAADPGARRRSRALCRVRRGAPGHRRGARRAAARAAAC